MGVGRLEMVKNHANDERADKANKYRNKHMDGNAEAARKNAKNALKHFTLATN